MSVGPTAHAAWRRLADLLPTRADLAAMRRHPRRDLLAGLTVAVVALPLALGFGVSSGLGPEAGLATAVVAGSLAALFGGSNLQVSGPTGAMTVILVPIVARYGPGGVLTVGLLAGAILVALALLRAGRYARYVPAPVVEGFTAGIAAVIFLQQVPAALGVPTPAGERVVTVAGRAVADFTAEPHWPSLVVAVTVAALVLLGAHRRPGVPFALATVALATVVTQVAGLDMARIGALPATLPAPSLAFLDPAAVPMLLTAALAVAALAALESLLSATIADGMAPGERHDPDRELFGQGLANLVTPLFGGVPATAAIARTAVNVRSGAHSRLAALAHALVLAMIMLVAAPLVAYIPLAALAGVLLATAVRMVELASVTALARATRADALIMALTAVTTVALDLIAAVGIGLAVAGALALRRIARAARLEQLPPDPEATPPGTPGGAPATGTDGQIVVYRFDGPLFFAVAHRFLPQSAEPVHARVVILRMSRVSTIDGTGALALRDAVHRLERRGIAVFLSGLHPPHRRPLDAIGLLGPLRSAGRVFDSAPEAFAAARAHLAHPGPAG